MIHAGYLVCIGRKRNEVFGPPERRGPTPGRYVSFYFRCRLVYRTYVVTHSLPEAREFAKSYIDNRLKAKKAK